MPATRSGRRYGLVNAGHQTSPWAHVNVVLHTVLPRYLDLPSMMDARRVCQAWRSCFSSSVKHLHLQQPAAVRAATNMGRQAATAFSNTSALLLQLPSQPDPAVDMTADEDEPDLLPCDDGSRGCRPGAGLLQQLNSRCSLRFLQLVKPADQTCTFLPALLRSVPQLQVLDLSCCAHAPSDLLVIAQQLPSLQQLILHCRVRSSLAVGYKRHSDEERRWHDDRTLYSAQHIASLAALPKLGLLEVPLPTSYSDDQRAEWLQAVATLTSLTTLHLVPTIKYVQGDQFQPAATALQCLSNLTRLQQLRCEAGRVRFFYSDAPGPAEPKAPEQAECWAKVLSHTPHLTRLELLQARACDDLLCAIGNNAPQLRHLVLNARDWWRGPNQVGPDAIAHVGHIELQWNKGVDCSLHLPLLRLRGVRRLQNLGAQRSIEFAREGPGWVKETCVCSNCAGW